MDKPANFSILRMESYKNEGMNKDMTVHAKKEIIFLGGTASKSSHINVVMH